MPLEPSQVASVLHPDQQLEIASKVLDNAAAYVTYATLLLAVISMLFGVVVLFLQHRFHKSRITEMKEAVREFVTQLASDDSLRTQLAQGILQNEDIQRKLLDAVDAAATSRATEILTDDKLNDIRDMVSSHMKKSI